MIEQDLNKSLKEAKASPKNSTDAVLSEWDLVQRNVSVPEQK